MVQGHGGEGEEMAFGRKLGWAWLASFSREGVGSRVAKEVIFMFSMGKLEPLTGPVDTKPSSPQGPGGEREMTERIRVGPQGQNIDMQIQSGPLFVKASGSLWESERQRLV